MSASAPRDRTAWVECRDGRISRIGAGEPPRMPDVDLDGMLLLPGLINAHCHLDYTHLRGMLTGNRSFSDWIGQINALKRHSSMENFQGAIHAGFAEAIAFGTTSLVNIEAYPEIAPGIEAPVRTWWAIEGIDIRAPFEFPPLPHLPAVSPHAPYTASAALYRRAKRIAETTGAVFTTHVGESGEENDMFARGHGPLHDLMKRLGRDMSDCGHGGSLGLLLDEGLLPRGSLLVHVNYFGQGDLARCAAAGHAAVHCPRSHAFFGHRPFALEAMGAVGLPVLIGTDSLASCSTLSLFDEMRAFAATHPRVPPAAILAMVTTAPAAALRLPGEIGTIAEGAFADLIAIPDDGDGDMAATALRHRGEVPFVMAGERVLRGKC